MLEDPSADVREAAVEALADIRNDAAIDALVSALKSKDPKIRRAAADALGKH
jgi:HEAT repeat protein